MGKLIDLRGLNFGAWLVLEGAESRYQPMWSCRCVCGTERLVSGANLRTGASTNCGCQRQHVIDHGHARRGQRTATYRSWKAMHSRCKPGFKQASDYYDRGIRVCERWNDYTLFLADVGERPANTTLDRENNDKGYEPGNCRWATSATQRRNSRRIIEIDVDGRPMPLKDASAIIGVTDSAVHQDRKRKGGSFQEAFDRVRARRRTSLCPS